MVFGARDKKVKGGQDALVLRYLTPHGKWNIHSTYQDNERMLTLFRGQLFGYLMKMLSNMVSMIMIGLKFITEMVL